VPSLSHKIYTLIGFAWPVFGVIFLTLLCTTDWFAVSMVQFTPVVVAGSLAIGHCIALALESTWATKGAYFFKHGMPLIFYRHMATIVAPGAYTENVTDGPIAVTGHYSGYGQPAIVFALKRVLFEAVDELYLTFLGTLEVRSYVSAGHVFAGESEKVSSTAAETETINRPDVLVRLPLSILNQSQQKELIAIFTSFNHDIKINQRLADRLSSPIVKGQNLIQSFGAALLLFALCDVTYATFTWLDMLKNYYGAQLCMRHPDEATAFAPGKNPALRATQLYDEAEKLRLHPAPLSWAYRALFANGNSQAQLLAIKAETLYRLGRTAESISTLEEVAEAKTSGLKAKLQLVRYLVEDGRVSEARKILQEIVVKHKDVLLPRVYDLVLLAPAQVNRAYENDLSQLDSEVFGSEPGWPPGGEKPIMEMWKRDDLTFIGERLLLKKNSNPKP